MSSNPLLKGLRPTHPGETLREDVILALGRSKVEVAALLGVSRQSLHDILRERRTVTPHMALRIGKVTGTSPESWLNMQQSYDLALAAAEIGERLADIPTLGEHAA